MFKAYDYDYMKMVKYELILPKNFKKSVVTGSHELEYNFLYSDSTVFFISNDKKNGSFANYERYRKYGSNINLVYVTQDTVFLEGVNKVGKFWREIKLKNVIIGYINADSSKKVAFDNSIKNISFR
ncbi:hypothetical protein [Thermoflexibacter ruber]|nr:hypothetical protein [Thermoflexibacter ruber]